MPERTATTVATLLADVHHLRVLVDVIALTASVCVVRPQGAARIIPEVRVSDDPGPGAPVREVVVLDTAARVRSLPVPCPLVRGVGLGDYEPDDQDSLDHWQEDESTDPLSPAVEAP